MVPHMRILSRSTGAVLALGLLAGCGATDDDGGSGDRAGDGGVTGTLTVFAAASLTDVFTDLGERLEADHPGLDVQFNFAGSSALATQVTQGAPADVFASANEAQMAVVADAGLADDPQVFAANVLQIAVPAGNPAGVTGLADLAREELTIAVCAPQVPCGAAAAPSSADPPQPASRSTSTVPSGARLDTGPPCGGPPWPAPAGR